MSIQFQSSNVLARLKPFGLSFEKSLTDLIKGIRQHSKESSESLAQFLDNAIVECKNELSSNDMETKAMAVLKLAYLEMYGFDMSWCNFHILEVMSSNKFQIKRVGYLAAIQSFKNEKDLLILATNQFKKDLNSHDHVHIGLALSGIATIVTPNLSKDINDDVLMKLNHTKPYIRKKAILAMYKIFLQYPESLRMNFTKVIEKLDDDDNSVINATINVISEISKKNPKIFVNYLPKFFRILEESKNNWLIIRILKLFSCLSKVESRMKKKILPSIIDLMVKTQASSLIYECINCILSSSMLSPDSSRDREVAELCVEQIEKFFEAGDPNLRYMGLLALINIVESFPVLIKFKGSWVANTIILCITNDDLIIKRKALEVYQYLINDDTMVDYTRVILKNLIPGSVPDTLKYDIVVKILSSGAMNNYGHIPSFSWYLSVLKDIVTLTLLPNANDILAPEIREKIAVELGKEFKNLSIRIPSIRSDILAIISEFIMNPRILDDCPSLLKDLYWIMGEYIDQLEDEESTLGKKIQLFNCLVNVRVDRVLELNDKLNFEVARKLVNHENTEILTVLIPFLVKLFSSIVSDYTNAYGEQGQLRHKKVVELAFDLDKLVYFLGCFENHLHYEIQERSLSWLEFLKLCFESLDVAEEVKKMEIEEVEYYKNIGDEDEDEDEGEDDEGEESSEEEQEDYIELSSEDEEPKETESEEQVDENPQSFAVEIPDTLDTVPMLLTHVLPTFFKSYDLPPISKSSQKSIPPPEFDLDSEINSPKFELFSDVEDSDTEEEEPVEVKEEVKKEERLERIKYDPYYINDTTSKPKTKKKKEKVESTEIPEKKVKPKKIKKEKVLILDVEDEEVVTAAPVKKKKNLLMIDSSNLDNFDLSVETSTEDDIDLSALRNALEKEKVEVKEKKVKKAKKKSKSKGKEAKDTKQDKDKEAKEGKESKEKENSKETEDKEGQESQDSKETEAVNSHSSSPSPGVVVPVKKSKKKSRAIIH
uniref:AP-3 complex subunit delta n=1 Tax=[Candida] jaroonii TaxID=467808 RepID=A0ACA9YEX7_9ASCO|nr:AP-3 complex subunit delta [[Candida] jaroonii]